MASLKEKHQKAGGQTADLERERRALLKVAENQEQCYREDIQYMENSVGKLTALMEDCLKTIPDIKW